MLSLAVLNILLLSALFLSNNAAWAQGCVPGENSPGMLLVGAFNINVFGISKMRDKEVVDVLAKILRRYDLILVQEIRDSSQKAFPELVRQINNASSLRKFKFILGKRVGRSKSKEQYGFIYRSDKLDITGTYEYEDKNDEFERAPFVLRFRRNTREGLQRYFTFIAIHTKPDYAVSEMNSLVKVASAAERKFGTDIIIAGDLNADCRYTTKKKWPQVILRQNLDFKWLISDSADTTTTDSTDCAYDRIILKGLSLQEYACCARVYHFDTEFKLESSLAKKVSDHYPVEFLLG